MRVQFIALAALALAPIAGCASESVPDDEVSEDALTPAQAETQRMDKIRAKVLLVDEEHVFLNRRYKAPSGSPSSGARAVGISASLYGVDWFQKWPGGVNADHGWQNGTEDGKRCMWAAVMRFEAIMKDPPAELKTFLAEYTRWGGGFYNWVDDYSKPESSGDASGARLWAWRTGLTKWISATGRDGSCWLPTKKMVVAYVKACKEHQAGNNGEMEGCQASSR